MVDKVFNTTFEVSLRVMLILAADEEPKTADTIAITDFITGYGKNFGISDENLHGDNSYGFSEFTARRSLVIKALRSLVLDGLVSVSEGKGGFRYVANETGIRYALSLKSGYAREYRKTVKSVISFISEKTERELISFVGRNSVGSLQLGGRNG
ncbi:hypothetical protein KCG48_12985 [Proteiniclasticum sp. BAD-10]|uniref:Uncharacterized protein n=1 Tax=Proteiniclasticum sediminis TaxID=2804028 RepID=A0A941CQU8_9CLOT|nr:ABC-three component system middle component 2 [Proteiniclasticum sediminis]MBR0577231.1 hypothetical protein [Proteiniclasticum sediminis]